MWHVEASSIDVLWIGTLTYAAALERQHATHAARVRGLIRDTVLLTEHPPVVTLGRGSDLDGEIVADATLKSRGIDVVRSGRGGHATYHGPGQLVGYPIVDLRARGGDVHAYLRLLERVMIAVAQAFGVHAHAREGLTGTWVGERKLGSIGVQVRRGVSLHGFALNVDMDLSPFELFAPCGMEGLRVTSLAHEIGRSIVMADVLPYAERSLRAELDAGR